MSKTSLSMKLDTLCSCSYRSKCVESQKKIFFVTLQGITKFYILPDFGRSPISENFVLTF